MLFLGLTFGVPVLLYIPHSGWLVCDSVCGHLQLEEPPVRQLLPRGLQHKQ